VRAATEGGPYRATVELRAAAARLKEAVEAGR
jgi:hypothetical protein